jgi:hypothetical protein
LDLTAIIAGTTLLVASSNLAPLHEFSYSYYDENSIIQTEEGTGFYRPKFPELTLEGLTHIENTGLIWTVTTPYVSSKYERGFNVEATIYRDFITSTSTRIRLSATVASLAKEVISACGDSTGRRFHCYHGTQPTSSYFIYPFERLRDTIYRQRRTFDFIDIRLAYILIF